MFNQIAELEARLAQAQTCQEKIDALNALAWELRNTDKVSVIGLCNQASELATTGEFAAQPYQLGVAASLRTRALWNVRDGHFELAASQCQQALAILETTPHPTVRTDLLALLARAHWGVGNYPKALDYGFDSLKCAQEIGDLGREAFALDTLGIINNNARKFEAAIHAQQKAIHLHRQTGNTYGEAIVLNNLADTYLNSGDLDNALNSGFESLRVAQANDATQVIMAAHGTLGQIYIARREYDQATIHLQQASALSEQLGSKHLGQSHRMNLGIVARAQNDNALALTYFEQALAIALEIDERRAQARCYEHIAETYEQQGDYIRALENYKQSYTTKETVLNEETSRKLAYLQSKYEVESAQKDAAIFRLKNVELEAEINKRQKAENELQQLNHELEKRVAERTAELQSANEQLHVELVERKRAEQALQKSELLLNATQELSQVGGWEFNVESGLAFWTREMYRIHEMPEDPEIDHVQENLKCYQPEDRPIIFGAFQRAIEQGEPYDLELTFTTLKGKSLWIRTTAYPIYEKGKVVRLIGNLMDITERKRAEEEIHRLNTELEQKIKERTAELETKIAEIERLNNVFVGRELRMIELKGRIKELESQIASSKR